MLVGLPIRSGLVLGTVKAGVECLEEPHRTATGCTTEAQCAQPDTHMSLTGCLHLLFDDCYMSIFTLTAFNMRILDNYADLEPCVELLCFSEGEMESEEQTNLRGNP
ncbi:hypothetical protein MHYP_G00025390 [Metynnis hypsauchen]